MNRLYRHLRSNEFLFNNAVYLSASFGVSFLNYLYYPVLGRIMVPADFGEVQTIISFFTQAAIFLQVLGLLSIGIINKYNDEAVRDRLISELARLSLMLSVVVFAGTLFAAPALRGFFNFGSTAPFIALGASLLVSVPASFANSYLQGHRRFTALSRVSLLSAIGKLLFAVTLVLLGFKALGAIAGLIIAQAVALVYALTLGKGIIHFVESNLHVRRPQLGLIKPELPYAAMVFTTALTINLMLSMDILVVKHYFAPAQAGLYTGISIISNIIYFITGPLAAVLIPSIKLSNSKATNLNLLKRSLLMCIALSGSTLLVFTLLPHLVVTLLLGAKYAVYAGFLPRLALALFVLSVANLVIYYHVALRHYMVAPTVLIGLGTTLWLLEASHGSMTAVVNDILLGAITLAVLLAGLSGYTSREVTA